MRLTLIAAVCFHYLCGSNQFVASSHQEIGESCTTTSNEEGICLPQPVCLQLEIRETSDSDFAEACKVQNDGTPVICCITPARSTFSITTTRPDDALNTNSLVNDSETRFFHGPRKKPVYYNPSSPPYSGYNPSSSHNYPPTTDDSSIHFPQNRFSKTPHNSNTRPSSDSRRPSAGNSQHPFEQSTTGVNAIKPSNTKLNRYPADSNGNGNGNFGPNNKGKNNGYSDSTSNNNFRPVNSFPNSITQPPIWGSTSRFERISEEKCAEYSKNVTSVIHALPLDIGGSVYTRRVANCKFKASPLVVGGKKATLGEYPHMAALGFRSGNSIEYNCGGSLISDEYVLTAAHCTHSSNGLPVHVRLGDLNLVSNKDSAQPVTINVAKVIVHPNYNPPQLYHDIALIKLSRKVPFNENLRPACLHSESSINAPKAMATGWGSMNYGEISSDDLLKVQLDLIDNNKCNRLYGTDHNLRSGVRDTMICAGVLSGRMDTCQGDSGGPLQIQDPNNICIHYLVGVTSFGRSCGAINSPGIYTRVSEYVPWIENIVWNSQGSY